jgi:hypothetical protein
MRLRQLLRTESDETLRVWMAVGQRTLGDSTLPARCRALARDQIAACETLLAARWSRPSCADGHFHRAPNRRDHGPPRAVIAMGCIGPLLDPERI